MSNTHTKSATLRDFKTPSPARPPGWTRVLVCRFGGSSTHVEPLYDHLRSTANQVASCLRDLEKAEFTTFWARKRILLAVFDHSAYLFRIFQRQVSTSGLPVLQNRPLVRVSISVPYLLLCHKRWKSKSKRRRFRTRLQIGLQFCTSKLAALLASSK